MHQDIAEIEVADTRYQTTHPGSQSWMFYDDEPLSHFDRWFLERKADAEMQEAARRPDDWVDPRIDDYHQRMEAMRYAIWLYNFYKQNRPDKRHDLISKLVGVELSERSLLNKIKTELCQHISVGDAERVCAKLSIYSALQGIMTKPKIKAVTKLKTSKAIRRELHGDIVEYKVYEKLREIDNAGDIEAWKTIQKALNGKGNIDKMPRSPKIVLFINPDGSRFLNRSIKASNPTGAKMAYVKRHNVDPDHVMVERVTVDWKKDYLRKMRMPLDTTNELWVVCMRKLSNEHESNYYDADPCFRDRIDRRGKWEQEYTWQGSPLIRVPESKVIPEGGYRLTVRDLERSVLEGALLFEDEADAWSMSLVNEYGDDRLRGAEYPMTQFEALPEDMQALYSGLNAVERYDLSEMLTINYSSLGHENAHVLNEVKRTIVKELDFGTETWEAIQDSMPEFQVSDMIAALITLQKSLEEEEESVETKPNPQATVLA